MISGIADVYITRLACSKKMIGYQLQPVEGVEPDVNTITFMMNPTYTMNGSLDGMTGMQATSDRFSVMCLKCGASKVLDTLRVTIGSKKPTT